MKEKLKEDEDEDDEQKHVSFKENSKKILRNFKILNEIFRKTNHQNLNKKINNKIKENQLKMMIFN